MSARVRRTLSVAALVGFAVVAAAPASAYCLWGIKWNTPPDANMYYNSSGKVTSGQCISSSQMDSVVTGGVGKWRALTYAGTTTAKANRRDGRNTIGWANLGGGTLGITNLLRYGNPILTCGSNSFYSAIELDVRLATAYRWTATGTACPCPAGSAFFLNSVAEHEYGHVTGLCHSSQSSALMYATFGACQNKSIGSDDNAGQNALCY
jgi:hypothetical protein